MPSHRVVESLDVIEHVGSGGIARLVYLAADPFRLHRREEALHRSIVPDVAGSAHRTVDAMVRHQGAELLTRILAALIRVVQQGIGLATPPDRHDERIRDELRGHLRLHRPADNAAREQVDHCRNVKPAFGRPDVGEVGDPLAVRTLRQ